MIAELAASQHDIVGRAQMIARDLSEATIEHRLAVRRLRPVHRGVYTVRQTPLDPDALCMAAVLLGGEEAVASHRSAAATWGLLRSAPTRSDVTLPRRRRPHRLVRFHQGRIEADEITTCRGLPVTSVPRTMLDLAADLPPARVAAAMGEAEVRRLTDPLSIVDLLERYPWRAGVGVLRRLLADGHAGATLTRSELEDAFLAFLDWAGLPRPETNVWLWVGGRWIEADCLWRERRLIAELDGRSTHLSAAAFEADRARDRAVMAAGWRSIRITWRQVHHERAALAADLRALLLR